VSTYDRDELRTLLSTGWRDNDYALFRYKPARFQRNGLNAATQLVLDFKKNEPAAREEVLAWCLGTIGNLEGELRQRHNVAQVMCAPRSAAYAPNEPCEWVAERLAVELTWLAHIPHALCRIESMAPAHKAAVRPTAEDHKRTMRYVGPPLTPTTVVEGLYCRACAKEFHTENGLAWHVANNRDHATAAAKMGATGSAAGVLLLDDVITRGATSTACRELLVEAGAASVVGFFLARTG
jgi:hypothetical protein